MKNKVKKDRVSLQGYKLHGKVRTLLCVFIFLPPLGYVLGKYALIPREISLVMMCVGLIAATILATGIMAIWQKEDG